MIYFCFIEGDGQHDVEMTLLEAVEDGPAMQEARALVSAVGPVTSSTVIVRSDPSRPPGIRRRTNPSSAGSIANRSARLSPQARAPDRSMVVAWASNLSWPMPVIGQALEPG